ncbi:MAG: 6-pyruvoyl tetrahydropterin synthase family protein [Nitrospiria bacterium]
MYTITREIHFCYGHRLLNHRGKCRHLHGHNGRVEIGLRSDALDALGMVRDFDEIKQIVEKWIHANLDHRMILCKADPMTPFLEDMREPYYLTDTNPTAEVISKLIFDYTASQGLPVTEVKLWETATSCASYRPTNSGRL